MGQACFSLRIFCLYKCNIQILQTTLQVLEQMGYNYQALVTSQTI